MILSGRDLRWYIEQGKLIIHPVQDNQFQQNGIDSILDGINVEQSFDTLREVNETYLVKGQFCLGRTKEYLEMPDDLMAFVQLRSTWARKGFMIPPTVVDAGFKGTLTLEILCCVHQKAPIGERFAHLIFAKCTGPCVPYSGKYQGQIEITGPIEDK